MTRRKHPPPKADLADYGFDVLGQDWGCVVDERLRLLGLDLLAILLYFVCLKPFADATGKVHQASYYRFMRMLAPLQSLHGGRRFEAPTIDQLRRALQALRRAGLITIYAASNMRKGALQIRVKYGVGAIAFVSVGPGVAPGSKHRGKLALVRAQEPVVHR